MEPVGVALIGLGRMGRVHASAIADLESFRVIGLCDPIPAGRGAVAAFFPDAHHFSDAGAALSAEGVEACIIAAPTPLHPRLVRLALDRGRHVLCEKPLSLDPADSDDLGELAEAAGKVLQVGFWRRYSPPWVEARRLVAAGVIGEPVLVRLSQWDADPPPAEFCDPAVSGGLAIDCGVHEYDLAEWFTGARVVAARAERMRDVDPAIAAVGDVDNLVATLRLDDGTVAVVDLSRNARYGDDVRTEVLGSDGAIFVESLPEGRTRLATGVAQEVAGTSLAEDAMVAGVRTQAAAFAAFVRGAPFDGPGAAASARATRTGLAVMRSLSRNAPEPV